MKRLLFKLLLVLLSCSLFSIEPFEGVNFHTYELPYGDTTVSCYSQDAYDPLPVDYFMEKIAVLDKSHLAEYLSIADFNQHSSPVVDFPAIVTVFTDETVHISYVHPIFVRDGNKEYEITLPETDFMLPQEEPDSFFGVPFWVGSAVGAVVVGSIVGLTIYLVK